MTEFNREFAQKSDAGAAFAWAKPKMSGISAVIIRADGTKEDLGLVSYWHKNPLRRAIWTVTYHVRKFFGLAN